MKHHDMCTAAHHTPQSAGVSLRDRAIAADVMALVRSRPHPVSPGQQALSFDPEPVPPAAAPASPPQDPFADHEIGRYADALRACGVVRAADLHRCAEGNVITVAGVRSVVHTPATRSGTRVVFVSLDDPTGLVDLAFFPSTPGHYLAHAMSERLVVARGIVSHTAPRGHSITGRAAWPLRAWLDRHGRA